MKKITVQIATLVPSEFQQGYYTLLLKEIDGHRQLPIIINSIDAQVISQTFHSDTPNPQNIYTPFSTLIFELDAQIEAVTIAKVRDGIFSNYLLGTKADGTNLSIEIRIGSAIALSLLLGCPIHVSESVMEEVGVLIKPSGKVVSLKERVLSDYSIEELENLLEDIIAQEDYKKACAIRDLIEQKKTLKRA